MANWLGIRVLIGGLAFLLMTATSVAAGSASSGICPDGFAAEFNANGVACTFCSSTSSSCQATCLGAPSCFCTEGDADCCEATPCCFNCPDNGSLLCTVSQCECVPDTPECCFTVCPTRAPAIGSPGSLTFGFVAAALAALGVVMLARQRRRRLQAQLH